MIPVLLRLGPLPIYSFGVMAALGFLMANFFGKRSKPLHVTEHYRDLPSFAFDFTLLGQDFL